MTAHQDELVVHDVTLAGAGTLSEPGFLDKGQGSAFESRVSELVLVRPDGAAGIVALGDLTEQLVSKGFHNLVLSLAGFDGLEPEPMQALSRVQSYLSNWGGSLRLCDVSDGLRVRLASLGLESLSVHSDKDQAVDDYRSSMNGDGEAEAALDQSNDWGWGSDEAIEEEDPSGVPIAEVFCNGEDLGKLQKDLRKVVNGGKKHVSLRLHFDRRVESNDLDVLTACRDYLAGEGGLLILVALPADVLRSFQLLEFDREFLIVESGDDAEKVHRQHASGEAVAATPAPADERPYVIVSHDGKDTFVIRPRVAQTAVSVKRVTRTAALLKPGPDLEAAVAWLQDKQGPILFDLAKHREAEPGEFEALRGVGKLPDVTLAFCNASHEVRALMKVLEVGAPSDLTLRGGVLTLAGLLFEQSPFEELSLRFEKQAPPKTAPSAAPPSLEFESGVSLVLDSGEGRVDETLVADLAKAQGAADRLGEQVKGLQAQLAAQTELRERAQREAEEASAAARRDERRVSELEQARDRAVSKAAEAEAQVQVAKSDVKRLEDELARVRQELDGNKDTLTQAVSQGTRLAELERTLAQQTEQMGEKDAEIAKLRSEAKQVVGDLMAKAKKATGRVQELEGSDIEVLRQRCAQLSEEKARILTEAEAEIERLTEEQQLLRSELENASEMIERLGKELELS